MADIRQFQNIRGRDFDLLAVAAAERLLSARFGDIVRLDEYQQLDSQHNVWRCRTIKNAYHITSVILKQMSIDKRPPSAYESPMLIRFLNEWASLLFLRELPLQFAPRLYAAQRDAGLLVIQDLGEYPNLQAILLGDDRASAAQGLIWLGHYLGKLQVATIGRGVRFRMRQHALKAYSPYWDATRDLRPVLADLHQCLQTLRINPPFPFAEEVMEVEGQLFAPDPAYVFVHGDAAPHNFLYTPHGLVLFDFEYASYGHGLIDAVGARLAFPTAYWGRRSPPSLIQQIEAAYRAQLAQVIPQAESDQWFAQMIEYACAHWVLNKLLGMWYEYLKNRLRYGAAYDFQHPRRSPENLALFRQKMITLLLAFLDLETEYLPYTRRIIQQGHEVFLHIWPDLQPLPCYPSFDDSSA